MKLKYQRNKIPNPVTRDLLHRLLDKDPERRIGAGGVEEIKEHEFFHSINWDDLYAKKVKPPYNPSVKSEKDVKHISSKFLDEDIVSYTMDDNDLKKGNMKNQIFEDFTYTKDEMLRKSNRQTVYID